MLSSIFLKSLRDLRRSLLWWSLGLTTLALYTQLFYPAVKKSPELDKFLEQAPKALTEAFVGQFKSLTSPDGYLNGQVFFFMVPLLLLVFAVSLGSAAIPREQERKTLDLLLSYPVTRSRIVLEKFGAMTVGTFYLALVMFAALAVGALMVDMDIDMRHLLDANLAAALLATVFGTLALALGCATGSRGLSAGVAAAVATAAYFVNALSGLVEVLKDLRFLSPFYLYIGKDPLGNGLDLGHAAALAGITVVLLAAALVFFQRRDIAA